LKVGHTKGYIQVLVIAPESMLGTLTDIKITSIGRWSVFGELLEEPPRQPNKETTRNISKISTIKPSSQIDDLCNEDASCCADTCGSCACSNEKNSARTKEVTYDRYRGVRFTSTIQSVFLRRRQSDKSSAENSAKMVVEKRGDKELAYLDWFLFGIVFLCSVTMVAVLIKFSSVLFSS
jgi:threonylcarbamoyladenosine tRNA methylthiotransferase CDKAL1